ncbi:hypothetical protein N1937_09510 [Rhizobium sp. WSM4643]|uniref:hypothetical protein n=1 Tax=Rhizobium sp. WSM4643 TaxID=3138253 RepID=UPI0021A2AC5C|nr:hypothetical protein [Rhizobium leguminosarum]UWM77431.1 hypothetical protein N1937_09510 [Rhizobium leguminosarum bv. viciae]
MPDNNKGGVAAPPSNHLTHNGSNNSVPRDAGKPDPALFDPRIEEILDKRFDSDIAEVWFMCPPCMEEADQKMERATSEGCQLNPEDEHWLLNSALAVEPTLRVRRFTREKEGELGLYDCCRCNWSGAHLRYLKRQYEAALLLEAQAKEGDE